MTTWITDDNGNRASVEHWGSEEKARASLLTLKNCTNCTNCTRCTNCAYCYNCTNCTNCAYCYNCTNCAYCYNCTNCAYCYNCTNCTRCTRCTQCMRVMEIESVPLIVGPVRSDGYQFVMTSDGGIRAGCRVFDSMTEAREHWRKTRGGTPLGNETMAILDALEAIAKTKKAD